jgi:hypothetical protein
VGSLPELVGVPEGNQLMQMQTPAWVIMYVLRITCPVPLFHSPVDPKADTINAMPAA